MHVNTIGPGSIFFVFFYVRPFLEEQALLREKLKTMPSWKKDKETVQKRKTQPMVRYVQIECKAQKHDNLLIDTAKNRTSVMCFDVKSR